MPHEPSLSGGVPRPPQIAVLGAKVTTAKATGQDRQGRGTGTSVLLPCTPGPHTATHRPSGDSGLRALPGGRSQSPCLAVPGGRQVHGANTLLVWFHTQPVTCRMSLAFREQLQHQVLGCQLQPPWQQRLWQQRLRTQSPPEHQVFNAASTPLCTPGRCKPLGEAGVLRGQRRQSQRRTYTWFSWRSSLSLFPGMNSAVIIRGPRCH